MSETPLTPKQARFIDEYLVDLNGKQAAIRAGYSPKTAEVQASRLLSLPKVGAEVARRKAARTERVEITQDYVLARLRENVERALQAEPVRDREGRETGEYVYQGSVANGALGLLGKHLGMFAENVNLRTPDGPLTVAVTHTVVDPSAS